MNPPKLQWLMTAQVDIGPRRSLGPWQGGERFIIDIFGGHVQGDGFTGSVLPGGADRQWMRPDGVKELQAIYELRMDDGTVVSVHNEALIDESRLPVRYACCRARLIAPPGRWESLNRHIVVGDVTSLRPQHEAVSVRLFALQPADPPQL